MDKIVIFNTAYSSLNLGDQIIMDAVKTELNNLFRDSTFFLDLSTHAGYSKKYTKMVTDAKFAFVGGTNLLTSNYKFISRRNLFNIRPYDARKMGNVILVGTGWGVGADNKKIRYSSKWLYRKALKNGAVHSVRDSQSLQKLKSIGIDNVVNTGCPTLWNLTADHCNEIPTNKSKVVVATITDYMQDIERDSFMLNTLKKQYESVFIWLQGSNDFNYFNSFDNVIKEGIQIIPANLSLYNNFLDNHDCDFVGTRLHAGIRAMQKKKRTIILSVDNRAREMGRDFNLNVLDRKNIQELETFINNSFSTDIKLATKEITLWRNQFKHN